MRDVEIRTGRRERTLIVFLAVTAIALASAAVFRPALRVSLARVQPAHATRVEATVVQTSSSDAVSLQPREMPRGCLNCPVTWYLAAPRGSR